MRLNKVQVVAYLNEKAIACPGCGAFPEMWTEVERPGGIPDGDAHWKVIYRCRRCRALWKETVETAHGQTVMVEGVDEAVHKE